MGDGENGSSWIAFSQRTEPALVSQSKHEMEKFSESESPLPKGSRNDFESWRKPP